MKYRGHVHVCPVDTEAYADRPDTSGLMKFGSVFRLETVSSRVSRLKADDRSMPRCEIGEEDE